MPPSGENSLNDQQRQFVARYLSRPDPSADAPADTVFSIWDDAKTTVDGNLERLRKAVQGQDIVDFSELISMGVFGIGSAQTVPLVTALLEFDKAAGGDRAGRAGAVLSAADKFETEVIGSQVATLLDDNPFGVKIQLQSAFSSALSEIRKRVAA